MSANSATRAASFIFRPFAASAYRRYRIPNAAAAAAYHHHMSDFVPTRWAFLVDTLALVRGMEAQGIESKHAEAITSAITLVLNDTLESVAESFASKGELQKDMMIQDANLLKLKREVQNSQDHHFHLLQRASEKLQADIDPLYRRIQQDLAEQNAATTKQLADIPKQIAAITSRMVAESIELTTKQLADVSDRTSMKFSKVIDLTEESIDVTTKLYREVIALKAQLPVEIQGVRALIAETKYDGIKYCIGTAFLICAAAVAVIRIGLPVE